MDRAHGETGLRLLVTGAGGMVGSAFVREARARGLDATGLTRTDLDVTDDDAVREVVGRWVEGAARSGRADPDWIVHCAAYTAVDRAESEPEAARAVNVEGTRKLARAAAKAGQGLVYLSTDYVFDGVAEAPLSPTAPTAPISVYGVSKRDGERAARHEYRHASAESGSSASGRGAQPLIVRSGWLYGEGGRGFVRAMLDRASRGEDLRVVDDQVGGPTWTGSLVAAVLDLVAIGSGTELPEVVHVADRGQATWYDLAVEALRISGVEAVVEPLSSRDFGAAATRPAYSVLDVTATETLLGRAMRPWKDVLSDVLGASGTTESTEGAGG